jgi:dihydrofolate reductase
LNVVVTHQELLVPAEVAIAHSIDEALTPRREGVETIFVIGGAGLFSHVIRRADLRHVYFTRIFGRFACDVVMPNLDALGWVRDAWDGERELEDQGVRYRIERLQRP